MNVDAILLLLGIYNYIIKSSLISVLRTLELIIRIEKSILIFASLKSESIKMYMIIQSVYLCTKLK